MKTTAILENRRWEAGLLLSLLLVFVYLVQRDAGSYPVMFADEQIYSRLARLVPMSEASVTSYLYFAAYGLTSACGTGFLDCARYLNLVFFIGAAPLIYLVARQFSSKPAAAMAALMSVLAPMNVYTAFFMPESMYLFAFWVMTWLALTRTGMHWAAYAAAVGAALGAMMLVKIHGLFLTPAVVVYMLYAGWANHREGPWVRIALASAALAVLSAFAVKYGVGFIAAGSKGLGLMGSIYEVQAADSASRGVTLATLLPGALFSLKGNLLVLAMIFATPLAGLLFFAVSAKARAAAGGKYAALVIWTVLASGAALGMASFYTSSVAGSSPVEGLRLHSRYYNFIFGLLLVATAARTGEGWRPERSMTRWVIAAMFTAALGYAVVTIPSDYFALMGDGPEFVALGVHWPNSFAFAVLAVQVAVLALWAGNRQLGGHAFLFVFLPLYMLNASQVMDRFFVQAHNPSAYDRAGQFARKYIPDGERNQVTIAGTGTAELLRAKFHLDAPDIGLADLPMGWPIYSYGMPGRSRWLLVVDDHRLPDGAAPVVKEAGFTLVRLTPDNHTIGAIKMAGPLEGALLAKADGLANAESWGRWSSDDQVRFHFVQPLPRKLNVFFTAQAFGPNADQEFTMRVGPQARKFRLPPMPQEVHFAFDTNGTEKVLIIDVPQAVSPQELGMSSDTRRLGMGVRGLEIGRRDR